MITLLQHSDAFFWLILLLFFVAIGIPFILFVVGLVTLRKNKKCGKIILIIGAVYALISFGVCGLGF